MDARHIARPFLVREGAIELVNQLPTLHVERLGNGGCLVFLLANTLVSGFRAVAGGNVLRIAVALQSSDGQRRTR